MDQATYLKVHKTVYGRKSLCGTDGNMSPTWMRVTCRECKKKRMGHKSKSPQSGPKEFT